MSFHADPVPALKQRLAEEVQRALESWDSAHAAHWLGVDRARVSNLRRGNVDRFSLETLIRFLARLRYDVTLSVSARRIERRRIDQSDAGQA